MEWWKKAVVYQIYPLSFCDSDADGYGDLRGIITKLGYLKELGVDVIWLTPVYASPMDDNGYDIADYYAINPLFGTMADFDELLAAAHQRGIRLIMDLVVNHTSDEHPWFQSAVSDSGSPYRDYYIFSDSIATEQQSVFSGSVWEYSRQAGQYYYHQFSRRQPDLNWDNARLRADIYKMINWWLDKGIDGFRLDVIDLIGKRPLAADVDEEKAHRLLQEMYANCFQGRDVLTVGETPLATVSSARLYSAPQRRELSMIFGFEFTALDEVAGAGKWELHELRLTELKEVFSRWQTGLHGKGWNSLFWNNHDQPRIVSRFGNDAPQWREPSAKMLALLLHGLQGTPYIYQGEELGMTNIRLDLAEYPDVETRNMIAEKRAAGWSEARITAAVYTKGRDNARTPVQWNEREYAGFSAVQPWLAVNANYRRVNAATALQNPDSLFWFYRKLITLRREYDVIVNGNYRLLFAEHPAVFAYERRLGRQRLLVVCNFYEPEQQLELETGAMKVLAASYGELLAEGGKLRLRPYEALMLLEEQPA